jgi:hypothetical protein
LESRNLTAVIDWLRKALAPAKRSQVADLPVLPQHSPNFRQAGDQRVSASRCLGRAVSESGRSNLVVPQREELRITLVEHCSGRLPAVFSAHLGAVGYNRSKRLLSMLHELIIVFDFAGRRTKRLNCELTYSEEGLAGRWQRGPNRSD